MTETADLPQAPSRKDYVRPERQKGWRRMTLYLDPKADEQLVEVSESNVVSQSHVLRRALWLLFDIQKLLASGHRIVVYPRDGGRPFPLDTRI